MDYIIIFYVLGAVLLAITKHWILLVIEVLAGGAFLAACAMLYLMEGKNPPHEMEKETPIFERIEAERELVMSSGVSAQIARRMRKYMKEQPPLEEGEYYAVFCSKEGVEVMRRGFKTADFKYMSCADDCRIVYCRIHSREAKYALAEMLAKRASELAGVYVGKVRSSADGVMFTVISDKGFEREDKKKKKITA